MAKSTVEPGQCIRAVVCDSDNELVLDLSLLRSTMDICDEKTIAWLAQENQAKSKHEGFGTRRFLGYGLQESATGMSRTRPARRTRSAGDSLLGLLSFFRGIDHVHDTFRPRFRHMVDHLQPLTVRGDDSPTLEVDQVLRHRGLMKPETLLHVFHVTPPYPEKTIDDFHANRVTKGLEYFRLSREILLLYHIKDLVEILRIVFVELGLRFHLLTFDRVCVSIPWTTLSLPDPGERKPVTFTWTPRTAGGSIGSERTTQQLCRSEL